MLFIIAYWIDIHSASFMYITEVGIYKRKQESKKKRFRPRKRSKKKERKHALDQETDQDND